MLCHWLLHRPNRNLQNLVSRKLVVFFHRLWNSLYCLAHQFIFYLWVFQSLRNPVLLASASQILFFFLFHLNVFFIAIVEIAYQAFTFQLLFERIFDLIYSFLFLFVEFKPLAHQISVSDLSCLSFLHFWHVTLAQLYKFLRRSDIRHLQSFKQIQRVLLFFWSYESYRSSFSPCSSSSSDSVNVIFEMVRTFEIDNQTDRFNVESSGANACCNHDRLDSFLKIINRKFSVIMVHSSV